MSEQDTLIAHAAVQHKPSIMHLLLSLAASALLITVTVVTAINLAHTMTVETNTDKLLVEVPPAFGVYTAGAVRDQGSRGTCWAFATMRFLEDRYRVQGQKLKMLKDSEYVKFSDQAHGINMINFCTANPSKCPDTPQEKQQIATDGYPSWIYHFQEYLNDKLVVDLKSCPYTQSEDRKTDKQCEGMKEFQDKKKLKYSVKNYKVLSSIPEIKQALLQKNSTFPLVTELLWQDYYVPCVGVYENTTTCKQNEFKCPNDMQNTQGNESCVRLSLMTTADAEFIARGPVRRHTGVGAHAMLLVGYNDEYTMDGQSKGGFIVQNSWGPVLGHSLDYLLGKISRRNEQYQCPNYYNYLEWVPLDYDGEDKYKLRRPTVLKLSIANNEIGSKKGHFHLDGKAAVQDVLKEITKDHKYFVLKEITPNIEGTAIVKLGATNDSAYNQNFSKIETFVTLPPMPADFLSHFFEPVNVNETEASNSEECGYYYIPYDFINQVRAVQGLWFVDQMEVQFEQSSFVKPNEADTKPGVKEIKEATYNQSKIEWTSHTPWLQNENWQPKFK